MKNTILFSAIETPDGTLLETTSRHDFKSHTDNLTGKVYSVDGGNEYQKISGDLKDLTSYIVRSNDPISIIRSITGRAGNGADGEGEYRVCLLKDMSDEWLSSSIEYVKEAQSEGYDIYADIYQRELDYRSANDLHMTDTVNTKDSWSELINSESLKEIFPI